jgi:hypothetical protein
MRKIRVVAFLLLAISLIRVVGAVEFANSAITTPDAEETSLSVPLFESSSSAGAAVPSATHFSFFIVSKAFVQILDSDVVALFRPLHSSLSDVRRV